MDKDTYDYIVIGAGAAGSVLAAKLAEGGARTALIEAGTIASTYGSKQYEQWLAAINRNCSDHWIFETEPQTKLKGRRLLLTQGKALGGGSAINAMVYCRGSTLDYDRWAASGCTGWGHKDVGNYFEQLEEKLRISIGAEDALTKAIFKGAHSVGYSPNSDYNNNETQLGYTLARLTVNRNRERVTSYSSFVGNSSHPNLTVTSGACVLNIYFKGKAASGVRYIRTGTSNTEGIFADQEIVLAAGALGTPRILMHSGLGNSKELERLGISVVEDLPNIGSNLYDDVFIPSVFTVKQRLPPISQALVFTSTGFEGQEVDVEHSFSSSSLPGQKPLPGREDAFYIWSTVLQLKSRGRIRLRSCNIRDGLSIDPCYLTEQVDLDKCRNALRTALEIGTAASKDFKSGRQLLPSCDEEAIDYIRHNAGTAHHYLGTCRMSAKPSDSVVDPLLRVWGIKGLRIADSSIMPFPVTGNTAAPSMMIGMKAASIILWGRPPSESRSVTSENL